MELGDSTAEWDPVERSLPRATLKVPLMQAGAQSTHALFYYGNTAQATRSANTGTIIDTYA